MTADIEAIKERLANATPGPWSVQVCTDCEPVEPECDEYFVTGPAPAEGEYGFTQADAELIAHAPEDIAALLADLRQVAEERGLAKSLPEEPDAADVAKVSVPGECLTCSGTGEYIVPAVLRCEDCGGTGKEEDVESGAAEPKEGSK